MDKTLEQCYETLGLSIDATKEEVRKAYKKLALKCHPDKNQNSPEANRKFQELGYAYKRITEDEELEEINEDCSEFDYWIEVFFYCLFKENFQVHGNREHCCPNCAWDIDEDEEFLEDLYEKHKRRQKEMTFTDEEMKHFVKFDSLKEQREFNKKIFCDSKKSSKPKNEPKVQKVKVKSNKQLKAEQWKREKEMSKIAEEIQIKNKQKEQKIENVKECQEIKKEKLESTKNKIEIEEQGNGNRQQRGTRHKEQLSKKNNTGTGNNMPVKEKPKKKHKKGRAKAEDNTQKFEQQEHKTCTKSTTPAISKPEINSRVIKRNGKPAAPVSRSSKIVQQPAKQPPPITLPQPPNIWKKRLETQNEIREIQPTNEEEELRQLEIALEMSKKQVEIEQQQKEIAALQEEIRLMSLEQEKLRVHDQSHEKELSDTPEAVTYLPDKLSDVENSHEIFGNDEVNSNKVSTDQAGNNDERGKKQLNVSSDIGALDDSDNSECDCTCTCEMDSTVGVFYEPQNQFFRSWKNSKVQTQACATREKKNIKEKKPCPYGKNCCLGKKCKYSHFLVKAGGVNDNQSLCSEAKHKKPDLVDAEIIEEKTYDERSASGQDDIKNECGVTENNLLVNEDWDDEIEHSEVQTSASNLLHCPSGSSSVAENEPYQKDHDSHSVESKDVGKDSYSCEGNNYEKKPVNHLQFDITNEICAPEDWDCEIEDNNVLDPPTTGNSFSQTKLLTERPYEEVQEFNTLTSNDTSSKASSNNGHNIQPNIQPAGEDVTSPIAGIDTRYTIQPNIQPGEGTVRCYGEDNISKSTLGTNKACMSSTGHEKSDKNWEEQSHTSNSQKACRESQHEGDEGIVEDAMRMGVNNVGEQSRNSHQQAIVDDATLPMPPCHQSTSPGMCPLMTDTVLCPQNQCKTNPDQQRPQPCLPFPTVGIPGVFPTGPVMHQPGLYNVSQMPPLFIPQLNYSHLQSGSSGVNSQASSLPPKTADYHPGVFNQSESALDISAPSESETLKTTCNSYSSISSTQQAPNLAMPNFPVLPNMYFGFPGNIPNACAGVLSNMNNVSNIQQSPLMAVPFPVIPGFLPALSQQPLSSNNLINMSSTVGKNSNNHLQKLNKPASGPVSADNNVNYQSSPSLNPSTASTDGCTVNGPNPIQSNPFIALESNYHAILEMQMNGAPQDMSCFKEHQTSTQNVSEETGTPEGKISDISESEYIKKNEDLFKMNDIRKPSSVPKALSYAERHQ